MQASVRVFQPRKSLFILCLMFILVGMGGKSWGQTIVSDGLNNSSSLFTITGTGQYYNGSSVTGDVPAGASFVAEGTHSFGVTNGTTTLTSTNNISTVGYTGAALSLRLASFSIGSTGNGADGTDNVIIALSTNGGTTYTNYLTVSGNSNAYWSFSSGTGTATTPFGTPNNSIAPSGGGGRTADGYSTLTITSLPSTASLRVKITLLNNAAAERWLVDDFKITGTPSTSPSISVSPSTLTTFTYAQGSGPSISQQFNVTGTNLTPVADNLTVTGSTNYEVSADNTNFGSTATIAYTGGALTSVPAYVRLKAGLSTGTYNSETVTVSGGGVATVNNPTVTVSGSVTAPTPTITSISPSTAVVGTAGPFTVTITGTNFISGTTTATYKALLRTVTFISATQVSIQLSTADLATGGTFPIVVTNTGNGTTATANFTVTVPTPTITSLAPSSQQVGTTGPVVVTITGTNFISGVTTATYNGATRTVTYISPTQVSISLSTGDMATGGTFPIVVTNTGNSTTATASFTVTVPIPTITSLSPSSLQVGSAGQTLTINGTNFINATVTKASFNGVNKTVTFVSATQITITLTTTELATGGTYPVIVTNTGNATTAATSFTVTVPTPTILSLSPSSVTASAAAQTLTINGTNFINSTTTTATYNGTVKPVTVVSATQITIQLTASDQATVGVYPVVVTNTGNSTSATASFTVLACAAPVTQATGVNFTGVGTTSFTVRWTNGNGAGRVAIINTTNTFTDPVNGTTLPTANTVYNGTGQQVIYAGTASNVTVTGLTTATTYYVSVYEYNNCSGIYNYQTAADVDNPGTGITLDANGCSALLTENFDYGSAASTDLTAVSSGIWKNLSGAAITKVNYTPSRGLVYPGYANGSIGGSVNVVGANASDVYRSIGTTISSGTLYMSFLMNFASATTTTNSYFLTFKDTNTSGNYYAKLAPKQASTTTYSLGFTKYGSVDGGTGAPYTGTYNYGQTYLVVLKYTFVAGTSGANDSAKAWILNSTLPASEAAAGNPTITALDVTNQSDAASIKQIVIRQASGNNGYIDGIRVATTWSDAVCIGSTTPITYVWQPVSGTESFATASNWSPQRGTPRNTDILEFSKAGTSTATGVVSQGLGAIRVINNTSVSLQSSVAAALGINNDATIADSADLFVGAGSSFNINSNSPVQLNLIGKASASLYGNVTFNNASTSSTPARPHRLTADSVSAVTFRNGSIFTGDDIAGSVFENDSSYLGGNTGTVKNGVVFQSGSTFRFLDGANPFGESLSPQPASAVVFNSGSNYIHLLGTTDPSFAGRTYGNFEYSPATGTATISSSTMPATILNNFTVTSGTLNFTGASQTISVGGNIFVATGATLNYNPSTTTSATITLNGTTPQAISGLGTFTLGNNSTLSVNNGLGVSLSRDLIIGGTLNLTSGSFSVGSNTLSLNGPAITGTPANLVTSSASSLSYGGSSTGIIIPASITTLNNLTVNNPSGVSFAGAGGSIFLSGTLSLTNGPLSIGNNVFNLNSGVTRTNGSITGSATSSLVLNGPAKKSLYFTIPGNTLYNLIVSGTASDVNLDNAVDIVAGTNHGTVVCNGTLKTNSFLTLKSDINGTAAVGQSSGSIIGNVTVERFTDASQNQGGSRRAWRLMTSPVSGQTIRNAWQEGGATNTGFGTLITGEGLTSSQAASAGFDYVGEGNHTSIKEYTNGAWVPLANNLTTGTQIPIHTRQSYMVFVRGDRTVGATGATPANIRASGTLQQGDQTVTVGTGAYTVVGNPYASSIDFSSIYQNNINAIKDQFYLWNSKLGIYGAYVLVSHTGTGSNAGGYRAVPSALSGLPTQENDAYRYIPSGSGFFVSPATTPASTTLTIREADKASSGNPPINPYRVVPNAANVRELLVNLSFKNDTTSVLADGFAADFSADYEGSEEDNSSVKAANFNENLGLVRNGINHIIEARGEVKKTDTLQLKMWNVSYRSYELQMQADNFTTPAPGIKAWLEDSYLQTKQAVSLTGGITTVSFEVNKDSGSWKSTRFRIVFENSTSVLPVTITKVSASPKNGGAEVAWTVSNEVNVKGYTVETSADGRAFTTVGTQQLAKNNPQASLTGYSGYDAQPKNGDNYYRIRIEGKDGQVSYSEIVKVTIGANGTGIQITLYPNPVREGKANLQMTNLKAGTYLVSVYTGSGQTVYQKKVTITLAGTTQSEPLLLGNNIAQGSYQIRIADHTGNILYSDKLIVGR